MSPPLHHVIPPKASVLFAITLSMIVFPNLAYGAWFGDFVTVLGMAVIIAGAGAYSCIVPKWGDRRREYATYAFNLWALMTGVLCLGPGIASLGLYAGFCLSTPNFSPSNARAGVVLVIGAVVTLCCPSLIPDAQTPAYLNFATSLVLGGLMLIYFQSVARKRVRRATQRLLDTDAELTAREVDLARQREANQVANGQLRESVAKLNERLAVLSGTTGQLNRRRQEEMHLVHAIHHDLREPLRSIVSFSQLIRRSLRKSGVLDKRIGERLGFAQDAGQRMVTMLDDLLRYAKSDKEESDEDVSLDALFAEVSEDLSNLSARRGATVSADGLPTIRGYRTQLRQLLLNLVSNALKYSKPGVPARVHVGYRCLGDDFEVYCRDNGIGISAEELPKVFGLFVRVGDEAAQEGGGVGLALCKRIVLEHGGTISAESVPTEGSTFRMRFPVARLVAPPSRPASVLAPSTLPS